MDARDELMRWLADTGYALTHAGRDGCSFVAARRPECLLKPGSDVAYPETEVAALIVDADTLRCGIARKRMQPLLDWRARRSGRQLAVLAHHSISEVELLELRECDVVVRWPRSSYPSPR